MDKRAKKKKLSLDEIIESDKKSMTIPVAEVKKVEPQLCNHLLFLFHSTENISMIYSTLS
jgi:hypothetical protein